MVAASPESALGYDSSETFRRGAYVLSVEGGGGGQHDVASHPDETGLEVLNGGVRLSVLPFGPTGRGLVYGALEIGLEPFAQGYIDPVRAYFAAALARNPDLHFEPPATVAVGSGSVSFVYTSIRNLTAVETLVFAPGSRLVARAHCHYRSPADR